MYSLSELGTHNSDFEQDIQISAAPFQIVLLYFDWISIFLQTFNYDRNLDHLYSKNGKLSLLYIRFSDF